MNTERSIPSVSKCRNNLTAAEIRMGNNLPNEKYIYNSTDKRTKPGFGDGAIENRNFLLSFLFMYILFAKKLNNF